jgi:5'-3' exonuclease
MTPANKAQQEDHDRLIVIEQTTIRIKDMMEEMKKCREADNERIDILERQDTANAKDHESMHKSIASASSSNLWAKILAALATIAAGIATLVVGGKP